MILVNNLKPGTTYGEDGELYLALDISRNKSARGQMIIKVKSKNLRSGSIGTTTYVAGDKVEPVFLDKKEMIFLYEDGEFIIFMDNETYEQKSVNIDLLVWEKNFLVPNSSVKLTFFKDEIVGVELPVKMELVVEECPPAVKGDTINKAMKDALLETGLTVKVPLFIEKGEKIIVKTEDGTYDTRSKS